ncbi:alpha-keto acid decarboxylase family protein [Saccharothrix australiensis]|uniref:Alpha-keto-acid decarboxylase n=1 Tax=Saccharothrix australiensis TaxID=2072 RepID=A0A495W6G3_9PSEU|nr:thiamine pyrophosphate-binding protein [Saccharothrix australiensis]RKT57311.1 indolepyruvate decarboxylase [Saccharothrix australiensis]
MTTSPSEAAPAVIDHLLDRLSALGVRHLFGMPGDYNLKVLDHVLAHPRVQWVGTVNELGSAYAADGYARVNGFGALLTTFGVGELNAINGVAGAYAERVPLLHIAIGPTRATERAGSLVHHTLGDGDFERFARAHRQVVCADAVLRPDNALAEIDRVLTTCLRESLPGYLRVPRDVALGPAAPRPALDVPDPKAADPEQLAAFRDAARDRLATARAVAVLADFLVDRCHARAELAALLAAGRFPHAVLIAGKTVVDESRPGFLGLYAGAMSDDRVRSTIDRADPLIRAGVLLTDMATGKFTHEFDPDKGIDLGPTTARVDGVAFPGVPLAAALDVLTELVRGRPPGEAPVTAPADRRAPAPARPAEFPTTLKDAVVALGRKVCGPGIPLTQSYLWQAVGESLRPHHTVYADNGTALMGIADRRFPGGARFVAQPLWASIGYCIPALLGAQLADPSRRGVLLIGDGSAQLTAPELGTVDRHPVKPIVVLVNNDGYTIERITHGLRAPYNEVARWRWAALPAALGVRNPLVLSARTRGQLDRALARATSATDRFVLIEVFVGKDDVPPPLKRMTANRPDRAKWVP